MRTWLVELTLGWEDSVEGETQEEAVAAARERAMEELSSINGEAFALVDINPEWGDAEGGAA